MRNDSTELCPNADVEAYVDGNLQADAATKVEASFQCNPRDLESMFAVARLNAALRKARSRLMKDPNLAGALGKFSERSV